MNARILGASLLAWAAAAGQASSQTVFWTGPSSGLWSDASSWSTGVVPTYLGGVMINTNSLVTFDIPLAQMTVFYLGLTSGDLGHLYIDQGEFRTTASYVGLSGQGIVEIDGTGYYKATGLTVASGIGSSGSVGVYDGTLRCTSLTVGGAGVADLVVSGGLAKATGMNVASQAGSFGILAQTGGVIETGTLRCDYDGEGIVWLAGGLTDVSRIEVGHGTAAGPMGLLYISDTADVQPSSRVRVGYTAEGRMEMTGGTLTTTRIEAQVLAGSYAEISLQGGDLRARHIQYLTGAPPSFEMTGGTLGAETFGELTEPWDLVCAGGTILPHADDLDYFSIRGAFILGLPGAVRFSLDEPGDSDYLIVHGDVALQGQLELDLVGPMLANQEFTVIDSVGPNPVVGSFMGLPEGGTTTATFGATSYDFEVTYVGGDGNDVVLTMTSCPVDMNNDGVLDGGDLTLFTDLFTAGSLLADFNGDGVLDGGDITEYVAQYMAGC